jgi:hypothetical protein
MASGLKSSLGIATESVVGTIVSPTRWLEFNSESLHLEKDVVQGQGLRGGGRVARSSRRVVTGRNGVGGFELDLVTNGMGMLFRQMLGSSTSALVSGSAYQQVHVDGPLLGKSLSIQKLVEDDAGTKVPFTYGGCKFTSWSIDCEVGGIATLSVEVDARDESTATAAGTPAYSATAAPFHFLQGSVIKGGTVSTSSGVTSVTGGTTLASVAGASITGTIPLTTGSDNQRFGNVKREQAENGWWEFGGSLDVDFVSAAEIYNLFSADTATALTLSFVGTTAISGSVYPTLEIIMPSVRFDGSTPQVGGPELVMLDAGFTALDDGTNPAIQIRYITSDTSIS